MNEYIYVYATYFLLRMFLHIRKIRETHSNSYYLIGIETELYYNNRKEVIGHGKQNSNY